MNKKSFAYYFKKFRLKSEFETLSQFADELADHGIIYETSIFSHWQKGTRVPKNRSILLKIIQIFISREGITSLADANLLLESAGQGYLTENEKKEFIDKISASPFLAPPLVPDFIGRNIEINKITSALRENKKILISGSSGAGKTSIAISVAHLLRHEYKDGVLWARADSNNAMGILANFALAYKENVLFIRDAESRSEYVKTMLSDKRVLIIIDNITSSKELSLLVPNSQTVSVIITSQINKLSAMPDALNIKLDSFNEEETALLFIKILGSDFFASHKKELKDLAGLVGNHPLALTLLSKKIFQLKYLDFGEITSAIRKDTLHYLNYQDQNIKAVFELSFQSLTELEKNIFSSLSVFKGVDFPLDLIANLHNLPKMEAAEVMESLIEKSFIQRSKEERYTIHPALKLFAETKVPSKDYYEKLLEYFLIQFSQINREKMTQLSIVEQDIETIIYAFKKCYSNNSLDALINLWEYLTIILWDLGRWDDLLDLAKIVIKSCESKGNLEIKSKCLLRDMTLVYFQRNEDERAKEAIHEGLNIAKEIKNNTLIAYGFLRIGMVNLQERKYTVAIKNLGIALNLFQKLKEPARIGECLCYLSNAYLKIKKNEVAKKNALEALEVCNTIDHKRCQADALSYLGEIYLNEKRYDEAKKLILKSLKIDDEIVRRGQIWIYNTAALSLIEKLNGSSKKAKEYYKDFEKDNQYVQLSWRLQDLKTNEL